MQEQAFKYDIVIVGLQPWNVALGSNCVDIAKEFSTFCRVLYVNRPSDWRSEVKKWINKFFSTSTGAKNNGYKLTEFEKNLWVLDTGIILDSINLLKGTLFKFFLRRNNRKLACVIRQALSELSFNNYLLFNDNDFFQGQFLKEELSPHLYIYYLRDFLITQPYFRRNGKVMEENILKKADYVFTNSHYLKKYAEQYNDASFYIGQGCSLTSLSSDIENHSRPIELSGINKPIVGYIGNLVTLRLDLALLEKVAAIRNDLFWIFVGPLDDGFAKSKLKLLPNVIFTGHKAQHELANFISCFSVCINPQVLNETTIGNYPRKIDEYMLFGKPVIARKTDFTQELGNLVYQYETEQEFLEMLDLAILEDGKSDLFEERISVAKTHTWENSVKKIVDTVLMPKA